MKSSVSQRVLIPEQRVFDLDRLQSEMDDKDMSTFAGKMTMLERVAAQGARRTGLGLGSGPSPSPAGLLPRAVPAWAHALGPGARAWLSFRVK